MKNLSHFFAALLTLAVVAFAGCSKNDDPAPAAMTFQMQIAKITPSTFVGTITPSDLTARYFASCFTQEEFAKYGTDAGIKTYMKSFFERLQAMSPDKKIEDIVAKCTNTGVSGGNVAYLDGGSKVYLFAVCLDKKGEVVSALSYKEVQLNAVSGADPSIEVIEVIPGDYDGNDPTTCVTAYAGTIGAFYGRGFFMKAAELDRIMDELGYTYEDILLMDGIEFTASEITDLNNMEFGRTEYGLAPGTKMAFVMQIVSEGGKSTITRVDGATDPAAASALPRIR